MDDEELRSAFAAWLAPVHRIPVPDSHRLRRRVRRRRTTLATTSALACAGVATSAGLLLGPSPTPIQPAVQRHADSCTSQDLVARWLAPAQIKGIWAELPPQTYRLALRNISETACSLEGWPRFAITGSSHPQRVSVAYQTHLDEWVGTFRTRVVEPTRIVLDPGATAVSVVNVGSPIAQQNGCVTRAWLVRPPTPGASALRTRGDRPQMCDDSYLTESPLYPPSVPITQNYP